jgi:FkbM family methyltransferase
VTMISYAQNAEDVLLRRVFGGQASGFYVDVGANHPVHNSVTKSFYDRGWCGINCEPGSTFPCLEHARPRDVCLNVAVSNRQGTQTFYEVAGVSGLSTLDPALARAYEEGGRVLRSWVVPVRTLAAVCAEHVKQPIDFLSIDAENSELQVLEGADWVRFRPRVVVVEANHPDRWEPILFRADYGYATFDGINRYYVRGEERHLADALRTPVNYLDDFIPYTALLALGLDELILRARAEGVGPRSFRAGIQVARLLHRVAARLPRPDFRRRTRTP